MEYLEYFDLMWAQVLDINLIDAEFEHKLVTILASHPSDTDVPALAVEISSFIRGPWVPKTNSDSDSSDSTLKTYAESIHDYDTWHSLFDQVLDIVPFKSDGARRIFTTLDKYFYELYFTDRNRTELWAEYLTSITEMCKNKDPKDDVFDDILQSPVVQNVLANVLEGLRTQNIPI
jgi:hypothetical protein